MRPNVQKNGVCSLHHDVSLADFTLKELHSMKVSLHLSQQHEDLSVIDTFALGLLLQIVDPHRPTEAHDGDGVQLHTHTHTTHTYTHAHTTHTHTPPHVITTLLGLLTLHH